MMYLYESNYDLAYQGGVLADGGWCDDVESTTGMDIADYIESTFDGVDTEDEYRDERDDSSRLAERHGC